MSQTDRIEKKILLRAPQTRVWQALSDSHQFGAWFGVQFEAPFVAGQLIRGNITMRGYEHVVMEAEVERLEPEHFFSYRWHPYAIDSKVDYSAEPTTLVEFHLESAPGGTLLRVVESGFDRLPPARRPEAFRMNDHGWAEQLVAIERYVTAQ